MMELIKVNNLTDIKKGDTLIISGGGMNNNPVKAEMVKESETDGVEIIFDLKGNRYFNLGMFLEGKSWVKELAIVR